MALCMPLGCAGNGGNSVSITPSIDREMSYHAVYDAVLLPDSLWQAPTVNRVTEEDREGDDRISAYYMRSDYAGEESYAFAYLGVPKGASEANKLPAVLLVHGGAGSAYWHWVRNWVNSGFVALAIDLEGHVPTKTSTMDSPHTELYVKSPYTAPSNQNLNDSYKPIEQTWLYYAVQTCILGNSWLHSLDFVDEYKIGACGVSWGGYITSIITGYDDRLAFSIPIYCTVGSAGEYGLIPEFLEKNPDALVWDDDGGIKKVNTPIYFVLPDNDFSMSPLPASRLAEACKNATLTYVDGMLHSQSIAAGYYEAVDFAVQALTGKQAFVEITSQPDAKASPVTVKLPENCEINRASVYYLTEEKPYSGAVWGRKRAMVNGSVITYSVPEDATYFYIRIEDSNERVVTSKIVTL